MELYTIIYSDATHDTDVSNGFEFNKKLGFGWTGVDILVQRII